ncbi:MAG: 23S rRNA (adenine(2503)-C(2))-methyltransferase RlmN [Candidatus Limnocylindria bacterium]
MTDQLGLEPAEPKPAISQLSAPSLAAWLEARGEPAYRLHQIAGGIHRSQARSFDDLRELPGGLRAALERAFRFSSIERSHVLTADGGLTAKAVHELADGQRVESVLMRYPATRRSAARTTICISSQAGCAVGCPFCATGQAGFGRQLSPAEIVDQVLHWHRPPGTTGVGEPRGHYNVVFMGMGEPLNNADRVFEATRLLNDPARLGIGARHITISTSGVVPGIDRMLDELPQVNLAVSLHAATDALRSELVPINRRWPIGAVVGAARRFASASGRRVSFEYVMIDGLNDTPEQAAQLARLTAGWMSHVNLIPLNPTPGSRWSGSPRTVIERFARALRDGRVPVTIRDTRGREIEAACGQLHAQLAGRPLPGRHDATSGVAQVTVA